MDLYFPVQTSIVFSNLLTLCVAPLIVEPAPAPVVGFASGFGVSTGVENNLILCRINKGKRRAATCDNIIGSPRNVKCTYLAIKNFVQVFLRFESVEISYYETKLFAALGRFDVHNSISIKFVSVQLIALTYLSYTKCF